MNVQGKAKYPANAVLPHLAISKNNWWAGCPIDTGFLLFHSPFSFMTSDFGQDLLCQRNYTS